MDTKRVPIRDGELLCQIGQKYKYCSFNEKLIRGPWTQNNERERYIPVNEIICGGRRGTVE